MIGNPQLGIADPDKPLPWVIDIHGHQLFQLRICNDCGGYYAAICPCQGTVSHNKTLIQDGGRIINLVKILLSKIKNKKE